MKGTYALRTRAATPADVLQFLQNDYLVRAATDFEVDPGEVLTRELTIEMWRGTCDLISVRRLPSAMNDWFGTTLPTDAYLRVMTPENRQTLGDLCDFIAPHVSVPVVAPLRIAGVADDASGMFFAMRTLLAQSDIPVSDIAPSTRFDRMDAAHAHELIRVVERLAGSRMPVLSVRNNAFARRAGLTSYLGLYAGLCAALGASPALVSASFVLLATGIIERVVGRRIPPVELRFGSAETFGDLSRSLVAR
ncbi:MAG TPA: hypothetical protein VJR92_12450 [Gemmatimonadaceae bacterium]|nr:hypothetical protein [Gemmatimonadaceae bacterium]